MVLVGEEPANLSFIPTRSGSIVVRSTYRDGLPQTILYELGRDYVVDAAGRIKRTPQSRIPDFRTNILFGKLAFNDSEVPASGNGPFFIYVDYSHGEKWMPVPPSPELGATLLPNTQKKLGDGKTIRMVAYGDSITAGAEASDSGLIFWDRWATSLRKKYPRAIIETVNSGMRGTAMEGGVQELSAKVIAHRPDLVLIGFGMNDFSLGEKLSLADKLRAKLDWLRFRIGLGKDGARQGALPRVFSDRLRMVIDRVRAETDAEIVLFSTFPPNPKWHFRKDNLAGIYDMAAFAAATEQVAREKHCAFADVYHNWLQFAGKRKPEDLLANNVNHPNDFGHWIYFQAFEALHLQ
ncbi:MAG: GDSL-type esterase/lipase family protein [Sulfuritalea sp.]|jgi:lysophospholipase L1-like esterase|nr:GDSL-type esterase/lipase family protein [Sulfuritalea sp.]